MATRMQQRRGTAAQWAAENQILAAGEIGIESDTDIFKVGNGVTAWNSLVAGQVSRRLVDAKGDILIGSANDTVTRLPVGVNGEVLVADSAATTGVKWAAPSVGFAEIFLHGGN